MNHYTDPDQEISLGQLLTDYNETLLKTLNRHAPLHEKSAKLHTDNHGLMRIKQELVLRRRLEYKWLNDQMGIQLSHFLLPKVTCI